MPSLLGLYLHREGVARRPLLQLGRQEDAVRTQHDATGIDVFAAARGRSGIAKLVCSIGKKAQVGNPGPVLRAKKVIHTNNGCLHDSV